MSQGVCIGSVTGKCVEYKALDKTGKTFDLPKGAAARATILGMKDYTVWNTTAPVMLWKPKTEEATACTQNLTPPPMNQVGAALFIEEDQGLQHMYLMSGNAILWRPLDPVFRSGSAVWLQADRGKGTDDPYDYFVEFEDAAIKNFKFYRVEAFPHLAAGDPPRNACDCERPDIVIAEPEDQYAKLCKILFSAKGNQGALENNTGVGNEPGHH